MDSCCLTRAAHSARLALLVCLVGCHPLSRQGGPRRGGVPVRLTAAGAPHVLQLWAACSAEEHARGLMGRRSLGGADGMLFVFDQALPRTFWMHDTPLPLDMLFFGPHGTLTCRIDGAEPMTDTPRTCPIPSQYVVELPGGTAARLALGADTALNPDDLARSCPHP